MSDPRVERLAAVLVDYSVGAREGQQITIESPTAAAPLVREVYRRILAAGGGEVYVDGTLFLKDGKLMVGPE